MKEYQKKNAENFKEYYENNAKKRKVCNAEKIHCAHCNKILSRCSMTRHVKTQHPE